MSMFIKRTNLAYNMVANSVDWWDAPNTSMTAFENDLPTHSPVLGPDAKPLMYEPKPRIGYILSNKKER